MDTVVNAVVYIVLGALSTLTIIGLAIVYFIRRSYNKDRFIAITEHQKTIGHTITDHTKINEVPAEKLLSGNWASYAKTTQH